MKRQGAYEPILRAAVRHSLIRAIACPGSLLRGNRRIETVGADRFDQSDHGTRDAPTQIPRDPRPGTGFGGSAASALDAGWPMLERSAHMVRVAAGPIVASRTTIDSIEPIAGPTDKQLAPIWYRIRAGEWLARAGRRGALHVHGLTSAAGITGSRSRGS